MDKATKHTFALYEHDTSSKYPDELKEDGKIYIYTDITDDVSGEIFVTEDFVLRYSSTISFSWASNATCGKVSSGAEKNH